MFLHGILRISIGPAARHFVLVFFIRVYSCSFVVVNKGFDCVSGRVWMTMDAVRLVWADESDG